MNRLCPYCEKPISFFEGAKAPFKAGNYATRNDILNAMPCPHCGAKIVANQHWLHKCLGYVAVLSTILIITSMIGPEHFAFSLGGLIAVLPEFLLIIVTFILYVIVCDRCPKDWPAYKKAPLE